MAHRPVLLAWTLALVALAAQRAAAQPRDRTSGADATRSIAERAAVRRNADSSEAGLRARIEALRVRARVVADDSSLSVERRSGDIRALLDAAYRITLYVGDDTLGGTLFDEQLEAHFDIEMQDPAVDSIWRATLPCREHGPIDPVHGGPAACVQAVQAYDRVARRTVSRLRMRQTARLNALLAHVAAGDDQSAGAVEQGAALLKLSRGAAAGTPPDPASVDQALRAAGLFERTGRIDRAGPALLHAATTAVAMAAPSDSLAILFRRAAEHLGAAGAHALEAKAWEGVAAAAQAVPYDVDGVLAAYAQGRAAYERAGNTMMAEAVSDRIDSLRRHRLEQVGRATWAHATPALVDSVQRTCAAARDRGLATSCDALRTMTAMHRAASGDLDAARNELGPAEGGDASLSGAVRGMIDGAIGHPAAVSRPWQLTAWTLALAFPTDVVDDSTTGTSREASPLDVPAAEIRALGSARTVVEAVQALDVIRARLAGAEWAEMAQMLTFVRATLLMGDDRASAGEQTMREAIAASGGGGPLDALMHLTLATSLEHRDSLPAALASARRAVRLLPPRAAPDSGAGPGHSVADDDAVRHQAWLTLARIAAADPAAHGQARHALARADSMWTMMASRGHDPWTGLGRHASIGETLRRLGGGVDGSGRADDHVLDAAHAQFDSAAALVGSFRARLDSEHDAVAWADRWSALHDGWVTLWIDRASRARGAAADHAAADHAAADHAALTALGIAELGRAQALHDLLRRGDGAASTGDTASVHDGALAERLRRAPAAVAFELVAASRRPNTVVVYLHHTHAGDVHVWLAGPDSGVRLLPTVELPTDWLARHVARVGRGMRLGFAGTDTLSGARADSVGPWKDAMLHSLDSLAAVLPEAELAKLPDGTELVIVPHAELGQIPFPALRIRSGAVRPYLVARFAVRQVSSLATLAAIEGSPSRFARRTGAAGSAGGLVAAWPGAVNPLAWAEVERDSVARLQGVRPLPTGEASERTVWASMSSAPLVHLVAHGQASADPRWARDSTGLWLRTVGDGEDSDGFLSMTEILEAARQRPLVAELIVLSACETGFGRASRSEGTIGLQRALLAAGARSVLASLWVVDDAASASLMTAFWRHWLHDADQPTKAEALRRAQLTLSRSAPPYYWAAFQLAGGA